MSIHSSGSLPVLFPQLLHRESTPPRSWSQLQRGHVALGSQDLCYSVAGHGAGDRRSDGLEDLWKNLLESMDIYGNLIEMKENLYMENMSKETYN